jgi:CubicO group peptidase (beta-lactamase class C family)
MPMPPTLDRAHWQERLTTLAEKHAVPGAVLGILRMNPTDGGEDEIVEAAAGVLNVNTGSRATVDSLFQIGSITKVWTATVAMMLVEEGKLALDAPIVDVLPELRLSDADVTKQVTLRHLLTHTSGIDGDVFTDTGRGDDTLELFAAALSEVAQNHPLGATWSYCNSGFVLLGRVIEKLTGTTWDAAMRERLYAPLGLTHTVTLPEEALLHRAAVGHFNIEGKPTLAPVWGPPRSAGPAGLICARPRDVLAFARLHLTGGRAPDGTRLLQEQTVQQMAAKQADLPDKHTLGDSWGLGFERMLWDGRRVIGHDGNTIGQAAFMRMLPDAGLAVTLLTNGGEASNLYDELYREIFAELAGVSVPHRLEPPERPVTVDLTPYLGRYDRASVSMEILDQADGPKMRATISGPLAEMMPDTVTEYPMVAVAEDLFVARDEESKAWIPMTFYRLPTGELYLHFGARATPKVA